MNHQSISIFIFLISTLNLSYTDSDTHKTRLSLDEKKISVTFYNDEGTEEIKQDWKRYKFKTAIIKLTSTVIQSGIEIFTETTLFIKDYGMTEAREVKETRKISMLNRTEVSEYRTIMTKDHLITIKDGKVTKLANPASDLMGAMTEQNAKQFEEGIMDAMNGKSNKVAPQTIAGELCECVETIANIVGMTMTTLQCSYDNFPFLIDSKGMGGDNVEKVTSFKKNVQIPDAPFSY